MPASTTKISACPPNDVLGQLVSGSLQEEQADKLFLHIEECPSCQKIVDRLSRRAEGVIDTARKQSGRSRDERNLSRLIQKAQQLGRPEELLPEQTAIPVESFVSGLRRCGLFPEKEVDSLVSDIGGTDSSSLAKALVSKQKLTPFQARVLLKGRWKGLVLGNYVILDKLGQGGMGSVFKAKHRRLGRVVCVKVMNSAGRKSPQMMERFRNEARTVAALSHPNFVVAHDADEAEGVPFLVMEYIEGSDLARHVSKNGPLPLENALQVIYQAATALQYAHDRGVTHRDIKPHNLLLSEDTDSGELSVKILDMGLARFDSLLCDNPDASTHAAMTNTGVIMGTVDYMSPEQALRSRDADNRSDIYSLGCTLHYLLTGAAVFDGDTIMARLIAHREAAVPSLEDKVAGATPQLDAVFQKMLAKKPDRRYQSMQEVADDIDAVLSGRSPIAGLTESEEPQSILEKTRRRRRTSVVGVWPMIAAVVVAFGLGMFAMSGGTPDSGGSETVAAAEETDEGSEAESPSGIRRSATGMLNRADESTTAFLDGMAYGDGNGRALLLVPFDWYDDREFDAWQKAFREKSTSMFVASTKTGIPVSGHNKNHGLKIDKTLQDVAWDDFDVVVMVNGATESFSHPRYRGQFEPVVRRAVTSGAVLSAGSSQGFHLLNEHACWDECTRKKTVQGGTVHWGGIEGTESHFVWTKEAKYISKVVDESLRLRRMMLDNRAHRDTLARRGLGRAFVIVPQDDFHSEELELLTSTLYHSETKFSIASSQFSEASPKSSSASKVAPDTTLESFVPKNYDFVFVVGGNMHRFHKSPVKEQVQKVIASALASELIVAATSESAQQLFAVSEYTKHVSCKCDKEGLAIEPAHRKPGFVAVVKQPSEERMVSLVQQLKDKRRDILYGTKEAIR